MTIKPEARHLEIEAAGMESVISREFDALLAITMAKKGQKSQLAKVNLHHPYTTMFDHLAVDYGGATLLARQFGKRVENLAGGFQLSPDISLAVLVVEASKGDDSPHHNLAATYASLMADTLRNMKYWGIGVAHVDLTKQQGVSRIEDIKARFAGSNFEPLDMLDTIELLRPGTQGLSQVHRKKRALMVVSAEPGENASLVKELKGLWIGFMNPFVYVTTHMDMLAPSRPFTQGAMIAHLRS